jgi:regulator of protease activity HflC (stomatin/prohibitin superfamily)
MELTVMAVFAAAALILVMTAIKIVPQQEAYLVERLGRFHKTLEAGMHFVIPFFDRIAYRAYLKEVVLDIPPQICITRDNVQVHVDGVIFYRVIDAKSACYGVNNFEFAIIQLAQTTLRSEIGKIDLDRTFEERMKINSEVIEAIDAATSPWGVKVLRYEIKSINPPKDVLDAMEKQMRAEREKRARILESEGAREAVINNAEGRKQEVIKQSEAQRQKNVNEAEGQAAAITSIAMASANSIREVANALASKGGQDAAALKIAEDYIKQLGLMAANSEMLIVPANVSDPASMIATAMSVFDKMKERTVSASKS